MKALFTCLLIAFCLSFNAAAQIPDSLFVPKNKYLPVTSAGVLFGVNVASLNNFNLESSRIGLLLGLAGEYQFLPSLGVAANLLYSQQGTATTNAEYGLNYLKFPVMLSLHDNDFLFQAGLYGAVLLKGKAIYGPWTQDITEHFVNTDIGLTLGLSYNFYGNTLVGLRFQRGFDNINKSVADPKIQLMNNTLQVYGGYNFKKR